MKRFALIWIVSAVAAVVAGPLTASQKEPQAKPANAENGQDDRPLIEVCFVLDTTGSMGGLIEGAKAKIWAITNQIVLGKPRPRVRLALVPFRDKGDVYVTQVFDLTDNVDQVYADLMKFKAEGGGDGPENVNQGLQDAIEKVKWTEGKKVLRIIYLVGDAPPHNEYTDVPTWEKLSKKAIGKGIYINTVLCGANAETMKVWKGIALRAEGEFMQIGQSGDVQVIETPFDKELAELNGKLTETVVVYGTLDGQKLAERQNASARGMSKEAPSAAADRAVNCLLTGGAGNGDLVQATGEGKVKLEDVKKEHLPVEMQKMTVKEQKTYLAKRQKERTEILEKIKTLSQKRTAHIKKVREEQAKKGEAKDGFDEKVVESLRKQADKNGIKY